MCIHIVRCRWSRQSTRTCAGWAGSSDSRSNGIDRPSRVLAPSCARRSVRWYPLKLGHDCVVERQVQQVYCTRTHAQHIHILLPIIYYIFINNIGTYLYYIRIYSRDEFHCAMRGRRRLKIYRFVGISKDTRIMYACISLNTPQCCDRYTGGGFLPPAQYISRIRFIQCSTYNKFIGAILRRYILYYVDGHGYTWNVLFAPRRRGNNMNLIFMEVAVRLWFYFLLKHPIRYILLLLQHLLQCVKCERTGRFSDLYTFLNNLLYTIGTRVTDFKRFGDNILKCVYCIPDILLY